MRSAAKARHVVFFALWGCAFAWVLPARAQQRMPMQAGGLAPPPPMQTGGLAPPPPGSGPPAPPPPMYPSPTQRSLEEAERADSGRGLEFVYFDVGGGGQLAALTALSQSGTLVPASDQTTAFGPSFSAGAGLRLLFLTIGPRFRFGHFTNWDLWSLNLDLGWRVPLGNLEPYAIVGGGFSKLGRSAEGVALGGDVSVTGFNVRLGGGIDCYLSKVFSVGGTLQAELMRLTRGATTVSGGLPSPPPAAFSSDASGLGLVVTAGAVLGLHF